MRTGKKISGGRYIRHRKKKLYENAGQKKIIKLGEEKRKTKKVRGGKTKRTKGGNKKTFLLRTNFVNIQDKGKTRKIEIKKVIETPSNRFLARQNILTKGTIVETELGKVKITNRPAQEGVTNGILIEK